MTDSKEMAHYEALAEEAWSRLFDSRASNAAECVEDALYNLERAIDIAEMRGRKNDIERLKKRRLQIQSFFESRLRSKS